MPLTAGFSSLHNALNLGPGSWLNDSRVTVFHIVLRHFALVLFLLLCKKICSELLLKSSVTLVFFISENALDDLRLPYLSLTHISIKTERPPGQAAGQGPPALLHRPRKDDTGNAHL